MYSMEDMQDTTMHQTNRAGPFAEAEHAIKHLPKDVESLVQRPPVKIALISCAGLGVIAGGGALINTLRATKQQRARAWFGREARLAQKKTRRAVRSYGRQTPSAIGPSAGLVAAGALIGAGLAFYLSQRRSAGKTDRNAIGPIEPGGPIASPIVPDYH